jgi:hypothetical protein
MILKAAGFIPPATARQGPQAKFFTPLGRPAKEKGLATLVEGP